MDIGGASSSNCHDGVTVAGTAAADGAETLVVALAWNHLAVLRVNESEAFVNEECAASRCIERACEVFDKEQ